MDYPIMFIKSIKDFAFPSNRDDHLEHSMCEQHAGITIKKSGAILHRIFSVNDSNNYFTIERNVSSVAYLENSISLAAFFAKVLSCLTASLKLL